MKNDDSEPSKEGDESLPFKEKDEPIELVEKTDSSSDENIHVEETAGSATFDAMEPMAPSLEGVDAMAAMEGSSGEPPAQPPSENTTGSSEPPAEPPSTKPKREGIAKTFGIVALLNFLSKFIGLARDIIIAQTFGTTMIADAFNCAYSFTGNILVLFGGQGGPFHSASVSILAARKESEDTRKLIGQLLLFTFLILSLIAVVIFFAAPLFISIIVPATGVPEADRAQLWELVLKQLRIMLPLIVIAGLVGLGAGISNTYREFFWPSLSPAVASIAVIAAVLLFPDPLGICLGVGTLIGAFGQLFVQLPGIFRSHPRIAELFKPQPGLKEYLNMLIPAAVGTSIGQLNVYIDIFFVSTLTTGSLTALQNANRLLQLPLGVLLTAMLVPILPRFTEQVAEKKIDELKEEFRKALRILWFTVLPLVTMLLAVPGPIVQLLFQRGQFNEESKMLVVSALLFLVPSAFFYVARDLLTRAFYAHQDSQTPFRVAMLSIVVKAVGDWALVGPLGLGGIALSTTLVTIFNMFMLSTLLRKKIGSLGTASLIRPAFIMLSASLLCGLTAHYVQIYFVELVKLPSSIGTFASLALSLVVAGTSGLAVYALACIAMRLEEPKLFLARLKRIVRKK